GRKTGLALFGGQGAPVMVDLVNRLQTTSKPVQLILMCGHNEGLAAKLRKMETRIPVHVEGFTTEVPKFMAISDFMMGKPGPGSISEAMAMKLPVIVERNAWTMPQERYNADWLLERGAGVVLKNFREIGPAVERLLEPGVLEKMRANAGAVNNRAVFEITDILERLVLE
ncbi:MAG TPA: glycosyltransferase, partial [Bryobacteraceae bacterium]|nr:glycosyltransferase [Bryobacteraceae bacterium]